MSSFVTTGAMLACSFGLAPCSLVVLPARTVLLNGRPKANIMDFAPFVNIPTFGMCTAPTNPLVIAETAAAMGVPTPAPCTPAIVSPWMPGYPQVLVQNFPALTSDSRTTCMWLGVVSITNDGQVPLPPPICTAPPGKPITPIPIRMPLTSADFSSAAGGGGSGGGGGSSSSANEEMRKKYEKDVKKAESAGKQQEMMSKSCDKAAKESAQAGQPEKAAQAQKMSETALATSINKKNDAVGDVNQCYRETMPPTKAQMDKLTPAQQQEYYQQRESISQQKEHTRQQAENDYQSSTKDMMAATTRDLKMHYAEKQEQNALKELGVNTFMATFSKE